MADDPVHPPRGPRVEPSEPLQRKQVMEKIGETLRDDNVLITIRTFAYFLEEFPIQIGDYGFVRDEDGELIEGYVYDEAARNADPLEPADNPLNDYFSPMSDADEYYKGDIEGVHLSDLCTFVWDEDGNFCPVYDDSFNLERFMADTGLGFKRLTNWSSLARFNDLRDSEEYTVFDCATEKLDDSSLDLFCLNCGFTSGCEDWPRHDDDGTPVCPECRAKWADDAVYHCQSCDWHGASTVAYEEDEKGGYWEPYCPDCVRIEFFDSDESFTGEPRFYKQDDDLDMITHTSRLDEETRAEITRLHSE